MQMNRLTIRCVVTAGPTREHLDPVRYFSNGSSGRMGYCLAEAARERGWETLLISGPTALAVPAGVECRRVVSAAEMEAAVNEVFDDCDVLIMCAAVADYRPVRRETGKMKKSAANLVVEMEPTPDIVAGVGRRKKPGQICVGFAAETDDMEKHARKKLERKNLDWIVANPVGGEDSAMESETNFIVMIGRDGTRLEFGPSPKPLVARFILTVVGAEGANG